jgi:uncharacterized protein YjiS (DUF1127 family)
MELIMSTTLDTPGVAAAAAATPGSGLLRTATAWWAAYLAYRRERAAIMRLQALSERELQDIGITRSQIGCAVRGDPIDRPLSRYY